MPQVRGLAGATSPQKNYRLVHSHRLHVTIGSLRHGVNMRWHIFLFATSKHVDYLSQRIDRWESLLVEEIVKWCER